jgi:metacaspase-1
MYSKIRAMQWLVRDAKPHDSLFFHCRLFSCKVGFLPLKCCLDSGHGGQTKDLDGDEDDGYDEGFS